MKEITLEDFALNVQKYVDASQNEQVLITRNGELLAVVVGVSNKDDEDLQLERSPDFWRTIAESRKRPTARLKDIERELFSETENAVK